MRKRYRNRCTGTIVEPSVEVAALNYASDPTWEEITEEQKAPVPPINTNDDPSNEQENPDPHVNENEGSPDAQETLETTEGQTPANGKEEPECSQSEQTATSLLNMPTDTSPSTTSPKVSNKSAGQTSAQKKRKSGSD